MAHTLDGQGDRQAAFKHYQQAVEIFREIGDQWSLTHPLCDLAWKIWDKGELRRAFELIQEYLAVFRHLGAKGGIPMALGYLAHMAVTLGDFESAARTAQEKLEIEQSRGLRIDKAYGLHTVGYVNLARGNLVQGRQQLESALVLVRESQDYSFTADIQNLLGRVAIYEGSLDEAAVLLEESQRLGGSADRPRLEAHILLALGQLACLRHDFASAAELYRESLDQLQKAQPEIPPCLEGLAKATLGQGQPERAARLLGAASRLRMAMEAPILPVDQPEYDGTLSALHSVMSDESFRHAWSAGYSMTLEEAAALAKEE